MMVFIKAAHVLPEIKTNILQHLPLEFGKENATEQRQLPPNSTATALLKLLPKHCIIIVIRPQFILTELYCIWQNLKCQCFTQPVYDLVVVDVSVVYSSKKFSLASSQNIIYSGL